MIRSLNANDPQNLLEADVCVIGAGAAGLTLATQLSAAGAKVLVLESGGVEIEPAAQEFNRGESRGNLRLRLTETRLRTFGGTTRLWYGQCIPLDAADFEARSWIPQSGWPFSYAEIEPYYRRAEKFFELPEYGYDAEIYRHFPTSPPAFDPEKFILKPTVSAPRLDFSFRFKSAVNADPNIQVVCDATVTRIKLNESGRAVDSLEVKSLQGAKGTARAKVYVLACGGIENARLLLASQVGNEHDRVGRCLQDHITGDLAMLHSDNFKPLQDALGLLYRDKSRYFPKYRISEAAQERHQVLNGMFHLRFDYGASSPLESMRKFVRSMRHLRLPPRPLSELANAASGLPIAARIAYRRARYGMSSDIKPEKAFFQVHIEHAPNPDSRVTLSEERDPLGEPLASVAWNAGDLEQRSFLTFAELIKSEVARLNLGVCETADWVNGKDWFSHVSDTAHPTGATRMAATPDQGVVDGNAQVFGIGNLFVAGSSIFATNGYANPTLTIVALSLRLADYLTKGISLRFN